MKPRPRVFISHDSRDAKLAKEFAELLKTVSAGMIESFFSSSTSGSDGIEYGAEWYKTVMSNLDSATDVVCLLTVRSFERPWILFEAGVAKGKPDTPVHGLVLGGISTNIGPFGQLQRCDASLEALMGLVVQLCRRMEGLAPDQKVIEERTKAFLQSCAAFQDQRLVSSGNTSWSRTIPLLPRLSAATISGIDARLDELRDVVMQFFSEHGKALKRDNLRANLMLPNHEFHDNSEFPGQLYFVATVGKYTKGELSNRFAPGEGVSGKVFLEGVASSEDGREGVSAKKLEVMPSKFSGVVAFPLFGSKVERPFGVVCVDFVGAGTITSRDLKNLIRYDPVKKAIRQIAALLNDKGVATFDLSYSAQW